MYCWYLLYRLCLLIDTLPDRVTATPLVVTASVPGFVGRPLTSNFEAQDRGPSHFMLHSEDLVRHTREIHDVAVQSGPFT
jgi:hypothetical protein